MFTATSHRMYRCWAGTPCVPSVPSPFAYGQSHTSSTLPEVMISVAISICMLVTGEKAPPSTATRVGAAISTPFSPGDL